MINKKTLTTLAFAAVCMSAAAQNGVTSPYSRYGFGRLYDGGVSFNKGMAGVGYGFHNGNQINTANPASYSDVDSLTCLFDMGITLENANYQEGNVKLNNKNSSFDYFNMGFRLRKNVGLAVGFMPISNIGYSFSNSQIIKKEDDGSEITNTNEYTGDGGIHKLHLGVGARLLKPLSVGASVAYVFGDYTHTISNSPSLSSSYSTVRLYSAELKGVTFDFGAQFTQKIGKNDEFTLGLTYGLQGKVNSTASFISQTRSSSSVVSADTTSLSNALELPQTLGIGFAYTHNKRLTIAFDYTLQKWGSAKFPELTSNGYEAKSGSLCDMKRYAFGLEWIPTGKGGVSRKYLSHIAYRLGGYYTSPYTKINGTKAFDEYGVTCGFGIPIANETNNRSVINISAGWSHVEPKISGMIKENYLRISIGLTFNEGWFGKWKFQ
ncbi:MAG: hypothetical protein IKR18_08930 [Bacteroidaceae bacterium]|nr:hypothetical protein [Bacteroidaceae bacterium]